MPCWIFELLSTLKRGADLIVNFVTHRPHPVVKLQNLKRLKRRGYRRHTRFEFSSKYKSHSNKNQVKRVRTCKHDGWSSLRAPLPHWAELLPCFRIPPRVTTRAEAFDMLWDEAHKDRMTNTFLAHQDPTTIMKIANLLFLPPETSGTISVNCVVTSVDSPACFSSTMVLSSVIVDSGASVCISPHRSDFVTYNKSDMKIKDLSSSNKVAGEGIVRWNLEDSLGNPVEVEVLGYHIPTAEVRLLSPQILLKTIGGKASFDETGIKFNLDNGHDISAKLCPRSNLPLIPLARRQQTNFWNEAFGYTASNYKEMNDLRSVLGRDNINLSSSQKELLCWHHRLSHTSVEWVQMLMRDRKWLPDQDSLCSLHTGPFIRTKSRAPSCDTIGLKCMACLCAKASCRSPSNLAARPSRKEHKLKRGDLTPGSGISADHYFSPIRGRLLHTYGREKQGYTCGSLFVDHASGKIFNFPQYSNAATETIRSATRLEAMAIDEGFKIQKYHADNGIFASKDFKQHCDNNKIVYSFSGVGAKHQNGIAERNIKTVAQYARANMLHLAMHWPQQANASFWPQAMDYAIWVFNRMPNMESGISPNELWSSARGNAGIELSRAHVFGCPVYVLDAALQDGKKIPKWNPRARLGLFLGFSDLHSSQVPMVLNVETGKVSPQFHVIFDDKFETVHSLPTDEPITKQWAEILQLERECYMDTDFDTNDNPIIPPLTDIVKSYETDRDLLRPIMLDLTHDIFDDTNTLPDFIDRTEKQGSNESDREVPEGVQEGVPVGVPVGVPEGVPEGVPAGVPEGVPVGNANGRPKRRNVGTYKDGPANIRKFPIDGESYEFAFNINVINDWEHPIPAISNRGGFGKDHHPTQKVNKSFIADCYLLQEQWFKDPTCVSEISNHITFDTWDSDEFYFNEIFDPRLLAARAKSSKYNDDNPSFDMATRGVFQEDFWQAMRIELNTLINEFDCWEYVPNPGKNVLPSTWAFKIKRYPDGRVKKFKARFCARGDRQQEGIDYFETWAPVVQWSTVRIVMVLAAKLGFKSVQCDITAAFIHGRVTEPIYVHQPRGFHRGHGDEVLKLKRTLYGLKQAPRYFFKYFTERLVRQGLQASNLDPCLFMSKSLIVIIYVDDILIYGKTEEEINAFIEGMKKEDVALHREGTAEGYLGVDIQHKNEGGVKTIIFKQEGLTKRIISALGLDSKTSKPVETPAEKAALGRNVDGSDASGSINYASVVGMLLYLGHSRPDISFATHQCARYTHSPKQTHEDALIRIGRYLKGTLDKGLILRPSKDFKIDCYPDADFAGLWTRDDKQDPHCVRSRTGYVINLANCPVLWKSKLQTEIALSTMEAEYVALSASCKELFPLIDLTTELTSTIGLKLNTTTDMHIKIHEDNVGALILGKLEPRRMTPRSKHYAIKYHWFREHIGPRNIQLVHIGTENQLGDLFTKGLEKVIFQRLRKQLMGW